MGLSDFKYGILSAQEDTFRQFFGQLKDFIKCPSSSIRTEHQTTKLISLPGSAHQDRSDDKQGDEVSRTLPSLCPESEPGER